MLEKPIIVDCRGHILGRLAATVAKELLSGQKIVAVRTEELIKTGSFFRNKLRYLAFMSKKCVTNPRKGPFHLRSPSKMFWRAVRGMLPHKTPRGMHALRRLKVFEGVPTPYDKMKRKVVPHALAVTSLKPNRKVTRLGRLSHEMGWRHQDIVAQLEAKRKVRSAAYFQIKKSKAVLKNNAKKNLSAKKPAILKEYGY